MNLSVMLTIDVLTLLAHQRNIEEIMWCSVLSIVPAYRFLNQSLFQEEHSTALKFSRRPHQYITEKSRLFDG